MSRYGLNREVNLAYETAVEKAREGLEEHGFGILSEINVSETLKKKLGVESDEYIILGACKPESAYEGLQEEKELGLLLPCNVIVYKENESVYVSAVKATEALGITGNDELASIAEDVEAELEDFVNYMSDL